MPSLMQFDRPSPLDAKVENVLWAPNGERVAVLLIPILSGIGSEESDEVDPTPKICIIRPGTWEVNATFTLGSSPPHVTVAWSLDSQLLAIGEPGQIVVLDATSGKYDFLTSNDDSLIPHAIQWRDNDRWNLRIAITRVGRADLSVLSGKGDLVGEIPFNERVLWGSWSPDGSKLATITPGPELYGQSQFTLSMGVPKEEGREELKFASLPLPSGIVENPGWSHVWSPNSRMVAVTVESLTTDDCTVVQWDGGDTPRWRNLKLGPLSLFGSCWSPDGEVLAATTGEEIILFDASDLEVRSVHESYSATPSTVAGANSSSSNERLPLNFDDTDQGEMTSTGFTRSIAWSPDSTWFMAGNVGRIRAWRYSG